MIGPCIIYAIVRTAKDKNAKSLDASIKNTLRTCNRQLIDLDEKDNYKRNNWKRMLLFAIIFFFIVAIGIWIPALSVPDNMVQYIIMGFLIYLAIIIILYILTIRDNIKLSDYNAVYTIKGYLRNVYIYRGTRVVLAYYDYIQQKYIIKKLC